MATSSYTNHVTKRVRKNAPSTVSQTQAIPGKDMKKNSAGGYGFKLHPMKQLERFLVLGTEGGSAYNSEKKLTLQNVKIIRELLANGEGTNVVDMAVQVSESGRGVKNDAAIFALAIACTEGTLEVKKRAYDAIYRVCRTGTHLFSFVDAVNSMRGWSRGLRKGVATYYTQKEADDLAYQIVKYRQRGGWTHKDVMRLSHPTSVFPEQEPVLNYAVGRNDYKIEDYPQILRGFLKAQEAKTEKELVKIIVDYKLTWEMIPTEFHTSAVVWEALIPHLPMMALVRNLGRLSAVGLIDSNLKANTTLVAAKLVDVENIKKSRIHPVQILTALKVYSKGRGDKGSLSWNVSSKIVEALNKALELSFGNVEVLGKNFVVGMDVSGSMWGNPVAGNSVLNAAEATIMMTLVRVKVEPNVDVFAFTGNTGIKRMNITKSDTFESVVNKIRGLGFSGTDCALPINTALKENLDVDVFEIHTDNETYASSMHPSEALKVYRLKRNKPNAKLSVFAYTATSTTIADPNDEGMMDFVGLDPSGPQAANEFYKM